MSSAIINGKEIGQEIRNAVAERVIRLKERGLTPGLAVVLVGDNQASATYVRNKQNLVKRLVCFQNSLNYPKRQRKRNY